MKGSKENILKLEEKLAHHQNMVDLLKLKIGLAKLNQVCGEDLLPKELGVGMMEIFAEIKLINKK